VRAGRWRKAVRGVSLRTRVMAAAALLVALTCLVTQVGQIPADYTQGSGTLVSGTAADQATEAALTAYPGGVVDRVVALGNGDYEVHYIGVNWPHHIFVNQDFQVIGADD
jgi:hypothetical protein